MSPSLLPARSCLLLVRGDRDLPDGLVCLHLSWGGGLVKSAPAVAGPAAGPTLVSRPTGGGPMLPASTCSRPAEELCQACPLPMPQWVPTPLLGIAAPAVVNAGGRLGKPSWGAGPNAPFRRVSTPVCRSLARPPPVPLLPLRGGLVPASGRQPSLPQRGPPLPASPAIGCSASTSPSGSAAAE